MIARGKSVAASSWSCSKPSHTGLTTRLRPTCDRKKLESWANRRKNVRLAAEVVRLVAEVVGDRNGKSVAARSMVMFKTGRGTLRPVVPPIDCSLTLRRYRSQNSAIDRTIDRRGATQDLLPSIFPSISCSCDAVCLIRCPYIVISTS